MFTKFLVIHVTKNQQGENSGLVKVGCFMYDEKQTNMKLNDKERGETKSQNGIGRNRK